jgi:SAM-dependent methyltransferase
MKTRESGMPDEAMWDSFFDPPAVLARLGLRPETKVVVEFGCGYGTFTFPAARLAHGPIYAFDIEPGMVEMVRNKALRDGLRNVVCEVRDFVEQGTGLPDAAADYAMLFNILHAESPGVLLREAWRVLRPGGHLAITHWNYDPSTPRGPSLAIRPRPDQCRAWAERAGFRLLAPAIISLPPYHYGLVLERLSNQAADNDETR